MTWPNSGNLEFGCIRDAWLAYATRVVEEIGQLMSTMAAVLSRSINKLVPSFQISKSVNRSQSVVRSKAGKPDHDHGLGCNHGCRGDEDCGSDLSIRHTDDLGSLAHEKKKGDEQNGQKWQNSKSVTHLYAQARTLKHASMPEKKRNRGSGQSGAE